MSDELVEGQYYLHENGSLIYKPGGGVDSSSSFVRKMWYVSEISQSPKLFFSFLRDAYSSGAKKEEIIRLAEHNQLDKYIPNWDELINE
jgi:hypothetical protein